MAHIQLIDPQVDQLIEENERLRQAVLAVLEVLEDFVGSSKQVDEAIMLLKRARDGATGGDDELGERQLRLFGRG